MFQRMQQQLAANAQNQMKFDDDIDKYLKDGEIDASDDFNDLNLAASIAATKAMSSPTVVIQSPQQQQRPRLIENLARHKDFGFNIGDDTDQISSYRKSSAVPSVSQQRQDLSQSKNNEPTIKPVNFVFQKKGKQVQQNQDEEDSDIPVEHKAPQVLKMKYSVIEKSEQQEIETYSEEESYKQVEQKRKSARQAKQRKDQAQKHHTSKKQRREPSSEDVDHSAIASNNSFEEYDYYNPRPTTTPGNNVIRQQNNIQNNYQNISDRHGEQNFTTINVNKNTRGPNAVKTLTVQKVKKQKQNQQMYQENIKEKINKSDRRFSDSLPPHVDLPEKRKKKDVSFSEKLEKSLSDFSENQNVQGVEDPTNSEELLQRIEDEGNQINADFHQEVAMAQMNMNYKKVSSKDKEVHNFASQLNINDLDGFHNSVDTGFASPVYEPEVAEQINIQRENEQRRRKISTDDDMSNLQLSQIAQQRSKESRKTSKTSSKTTSKDVKEKPTKKTKEPKQRRQKTQKQREDINDENYSLQLSDYSDVSSSIVNEYMHLADTQSQSTSMPKKSRINMLATAQVEQSVARAAGEAVSELFDLAVIAAANPIDLVNKKLAVYTTPYEERQLVTINIKDGALKGKRIPIRKMLGEDLIYQNGQAVQIKLCFIDNEIHEKRMVRNAQERKPYPQRFQQTLRKLDPRADETFMFEKNKRSRSINPVTRFEKYEFEEVAPGCFKAGISKVDRRQQEIITIEAGKGYNKLRYNQTVSLLQASGESEVVMHGTNKQSYKLRQYDSLVIPSDIAFSIKQIYDKTSVLLLSSNVESEK